MNKTAARLLTFFIGVPLVLAIVLFPYMNHLPLQILLCVVCSLAAGELHDLFSTRYTLFPKPLVILLSVAVQASASTLSLLSNFGKSQVFGMELITYAYVFVILLILMIESLTSTDFTDSIVKTVLSIFIITYTGFFLSFVTRMTMFTIDGKRISEPVICVFILMVFMCDSIAWLLGILFGKGTRGVIKASPNKSIVGFAGGFIGSIASGFVGSYVWPDIFARSGLEPWRIVVLGALLALSSIVGDLAESVFKRSADIKDSGKLIPGRGGVLDSIDSILLSAPVYYVAVTLLFGPFN